MPQFEYDENKSNANFEKHGIDFVQAQKLWGDVNRLAIEAHSDAEIRFALIATIDDKCWTAICTQRGKNIRIISVRRSWEDEKEIYNNG
jgi:uncharacterized DUF497 family protein